MADSKSGGGSSATQEKSSSSKGVKDDRYGGDEPLPYPDTEPLTEVTYRDPRPLDWPQVADRNVYVSPVLKADPDDEDDPKGDYVNLGAADRDDQGVAEVKVGGTPVTDAQVIAGGNHLTLILNGEAFTLGALGGGLSSELTRALQVNANS